MAFQDCIGAIDGTHVTARVLRSQATTYSQNVLDVIDFDLKSTYMLAAWEGSSHNANVPTDSVPQPNGINIPRW